MPRKSDIVRLRHMLDAAQEAVEFTSGHTQEDFCRHRQLQLAVLHCIAIIGEAGANVTTEYRDAHPEVPWREIVGMRNRLVHAYFDVNTALAWKTVVEVLPPFIALLEGLVHAEEAGQDPLPEP